MADKAAFRARMQARERTIPEEERRIGDQILRERFLDHPRAIAAGTLLLFAGMGLEVDTRPLLERLSRTGKRVLLPRCLSEGRMEARCYADGRLVRHRYGMLEPDESCPIVEKGDIDLILVPALCYDRRCCRLGRGGGYYDRYLADYPGYTIGLCRETLLCQAVPMEPWDRPVDEVLTERERLVRADRTSPTPIRSGG